MRILSDGFYFTNEEYESIIKTEDGYFLKKVAPKKYSMDKESLICLIRERKKMSEICIEYECSMTYLRKKLKEYFGETKFTTIMLNLNNYL